MREDFWAGPLTWSAFLVLLALVGLPMATAPGSPRAVDVPVASVQALHRELGPEGFLGGLRHFATEPRTPALDSLAGHLDRADAHRAAIVSDADPHAASDYREQSVWLIGLYRDLLRQVATNGEPAIAPAISTAIAAYGLLRAATPADWMSPAAPPAYRLPVPVTAAAVALSGLLLFAAGLLRRRRLQDLKRLADAASGAANRIAVDPLGPTPENARLDILSDALVRLAATRDPEDGVGTALAHAAPADHTPSDLSEPVPVDSAGHDPITTAGLPTVAIGTQGMEPDWDRLVGLPLNQALGRIHQLEVQYGRMWEQAFRLLAENSARLSGNLDGTELAVAQFEHRLQGLEETYGRVLRTVSASAEALPERLMGAIRNLERHGEDLAAFQKSVKSRWEGPIGVVHETSESLRHLHDRMTSAFEQSIHENRQVQLHLAGALRVIDGSGRMLQHQSETAAGILSGLTGLREQLAGHVGLLDRHGGDLRQVIERLASVEGPADQLAALKQGLGQLGDVVAALDRDLRQRTGDIVDSLGSVDGAAGTAAQGLDGLSRGMSQLVERVDAADRQIGDILNSLDRTNGAARMGADAVEELCGSAEQAGIDLARLGNALTDCLRELAVVHDRAGEVGRVLALVPSPMPSPYPPSAPDLRSEVDRILFLVSESLAGTGALQDGVLRLSDQVRDVAGSLIGQQDLLVAIGERSQGLELRFQEASTAQAQRLEDRLARLDTTVRAEIDTGAMALGTTVHAGLARLETLMAQLGTTIEGSIVSVAAGADILSPAPVTGEPLLDLKVQVVMMRDRLEEIGRLLTTAAVPADPPAAGGNSAELIAHLRAGLEDLGAALMQRIGTAAPGLEGLLRDQEAELRLLGELVRAVLDRIPALPTTDVGGAVEADILARNLAERLDAPLAAMADRLQATLERNGTVVLAGMDMRLADLAAEPARHGGLEGGPWNETVQRLFATLAEAERRLRQTDENLSGLQDGLRDQTREAERSLQAARDALADIMAGLEARGARVADRLEAGTETAAAMTDRLAAALADLETRLAGWADRFAAKLSASEGMDEPGMQDDLTVLDRLAQRVAHLTVGLAQALATAPTPPISAARLALLDRTAHALNTASTALAVYSDAQEA